MKQTDFNFLVTNVTAISTQSFSIRCEEFGAGMSADESNNMTKVEFDLEQQHENFDYQAILDSGYRDTDSLEAELSSAMLILDRNKLNDLLNQLPNDLPNLQQKITGEQLKAWISYVLDLENDNPVSLLNQYVMSLFQVDDDIHDLIREAIAFDKTDELQEEADNIKAEHIKVEDLETAAEIGSFKAFEWLFKKAALDEVKTIELLFCENCIDAPFVFENLYKIIKPTDELRSTIIAKAKNSGYDAVIDFLQQTETIK